ncbi:MAG: hypothetical protein ACKOBV_04110, partial [Candidatus Kapaibacterium sp.]
MTGRKSPPLRIAADSDSKPICFPCYLRASSTVTPSMPQHLFTPGPTPLPAAVTARLREEPPY